MIRDIYIDNVLRERWNDDATPRTVTFYNASGVQTSQRQYTAFEAAAVDEAKAAATANTNRQTLEDKGRAALAANATFLAITSPTNAQTLAQVQKLTRQMNALIKLELRDLADVVGT